jgi:hypothetical protein
MVAKSRATWFAIDRPGEISCDTILTLSSIKPISVCGETDDASDVDFEYD